MKSLNKLLFASAFGTALLLAGQVAAWADESTDPIKIVTNNWTSQLVLSNVVGQILQAQGENVEYKSSDTQLQFTAIAAGDMDFQVEVMKR
jgi:glycine betaine/proline transport system substrate-binding protein